MRIRCLTVCVLCGLFSSASAGIHRCQTADGTVFQDLPCAEDSEVVLEGMSHSVGTAVRDSERRWLEQRLKHKQRLRESRDSAAAPQTAARDSAHKRRCWKKRTRLEAIRDQLRRGYTASQGNKLRRQRRTHEDYLSRFCD